MTTIWEYVQQRTHGGSETWRHAVLHAANLLVSRTEWNERVGTSPPRECRLKAAALLIYGLAHDRRADPRTIGGDDLAVWVTLRSMRQGRIDLAELLRAAGHDVPEPGLIGQEDRDPVIADWQDLVDDPGWCSAADVLSDIRTSPALPEAFSEIVRVFGDPDLPIGAGPGPQQHR